MQRWAWFFSACLALMGSPSWSRGDDAASRDAVLALLRANKLEEAEKTFQAAIQQHPESRQLHSLRFLLMGYHRRAGNHAQALAHIEAYLDHQLTSAERGQPGGNFAQLFDELSALLQPVGQASAALPRLETLIARVAVLAEKSDLPAIHVDLAALRGRQVLLLAESGDEGNAKAAQMLAHLVNEARKAHAAGSDGARAALMLAEYLRVQSQLAAKSSAEEARKLAAERVALLAAQAQKTPTAEVLSAYLGAASLRARSLRDEDLDAAEKQLDEVEALVKSLADHPTAPTAALQNGERLVKSLRSSLAAARVHQSLIGQPAVPLDVKDWVHGAPLAPEDLKGKVVLLDFWAVWCGPCIATFPHLREWHEKYADRGLVIVGMTRHYQYGWNDEAKRGEQSPGITPEDENAAMVRFAEHHQLKHRFAVTPAESTFWNQYGVTSIPQAVLIDRAGKVRMIRVGSGEANAKALHETIKKLLAEEPVQ